MLSSTLHYTLDAERYIVWNAGSPARCVNSGPVPWLPRDAHSCSLRLCTVGQRLGRGNSGLARCRSPITGQIEGSDPLEVCAGSSQREAPSRMPFAERNPPDIPILPGPDFRYVFRACSPTPGLSVLLQGPLSSSCSPPAPLSSPGTSTPRRPPVRPSTTRHTRSDGGMD